MPKAKTAHRKKNAKKKNPALRQFFNKVSNNDFKFPRNLRRAILREMDQEQRGFKKKAVDYHTRILQSPQSQNPFEQAGRLPKFKSRFLELWDEQMNPQNFEMPDLLNNRKHSTGKVGKLLWLEKAKVEVPNAEKPTELKETEWKPVSIAPDKVKGYFDTKRVELKESGPEPETNFQGQVSIPDHAAGKFFPYPPNSFTRQMYVPDSWFMLARCAHAYNYNPLAKSLVDIKTNFIIGNGPSLIINNNEQLVKLWKDFEKTEDFVETLRTWCSMLGINGELFIEFYRNLMGNPAVHSIDPGHVYEIITEPRDIRTVYGYKLMYQTQMQLFGTGARGETVPLSEWIYETIAPDNIMHIKINVQENEKRGRSDLLCGLAIFQLFEDYIRYKVLRTIVEAAFVWDVEMQGADQEQIDSFLDNEEQAFPAPGSTRAHNESTKWTPLANNSAAGGRDEVFEMLLTIGALSQNLPKEYAGASGSGGRANAITSTEPSVKAFQARRRKMESLIMRIVDFLASFNNVTYDPGQVEVSWEEIAPEDTSKKVDRLYTEVDRNTFTKKRVDEMIAKLEGVSNYGWSDEMQNRLQELVSGIVKSLSDGSPNMTGAGLEQPEGGQPVVAKPAPPQTVAAPTPAGAKTAATSPATSGAPSSLSAQDKLDVKRQGKAL